MKRRLAWLGLSFALAELFAAYMPPLVLVPAAALFVWLLFVYRKSSLRIPFVGALAGLLFFALYSALAVAPVRQYAGRQVQCTVVVQTDAESSYRDGYQRGTLRVTQCDGESVDFSVTCAAFPAAEPGDSFSALFALEELEKDSYRLSYQSRGVYLQAEYLEGYQKQEASASPIFALFRLRRQLAELLQRWMPEEEGELEAAMLLGHKQGLRDSVQDSFRTAGVSHLLAVSGLHVALFCGIFSFGRRRRFVRPLILLRVVLVLFYMVLTGLPVSVMRAGLVFLIALAGDFFWQPVDLLTSTGAAALVLGLQNAYAPCDVGFQLSFCAVLGVQAAVSLSQWEEKTLPEVTGAAATARTLALTGIQAVQVAAFASLATLPVLIAHGLTASGVSVLTNLLVVWMMQPALVMGILVLCFAAVSLLAPLGHITSLLLSVWLHGMLAIVNWCAALPQAHIDLPVRYTLLVFGVLGVLAWLFWRAKRLLWYLPAAVLCSAVAVVLGIAAQRDVVQIALVGAGNNPCLVCTQNDSAVILFRGGQSNLNAVEEYLAEQALPAVTMLVDLRQEPSELDFSGFPVTTVEELSAYSRCSMLDDLTLDLYHENSGNLAVLGIGERHVAIMTGKIRLSQPVEVDVFCAAGALSDWVQADTILTCTDSPAWMPSGEVNLFYGAEVPVIVIRPGRSITLEEVEPLALQ